MDGQEGQNLKSLVFQGRVSSWATQREVSKVCEEASEEPRAPLLLGSNRETS